MVAPTTAVAPLAPEDVRGTAYGYGPDGASVQEDLVAEKWTDRFIMKTTVLYGTPRVFARSFCHKLRSAAGAPGKQRNSLLKPAWERVMNMGLAGCSVAKLQGRGTDKAAVVLPDGAQVKIIYHNELMTLCGVSLRELTEPMKKKSAKAKAEARARSRSPRRMIRSGVVAGQGGDPKAPADTQT